MKAFRSVALVGVMFCLGCPQGTPKSASVDLSKSTATVDRASGVKADGADKATVSVVLIDTAGNPMQGQLVQISASGSGNSLTAAPLTDASGKTSSALTSTVAETKTVTVQTNAGALTTQPTVVFITAVGGAARLALNTQPGNAQSGAVLTPAIKVAVQDASGNLVASSTASISVSLTGGTAGATLSGTTTVAAVNGVASFTDLSVDKTGTAYTLTFSSSGLTSIQSSPFNVTAGTSSKLAFQVQPSGVGAGAAFSPVVTVAVQDASGNVVTNAAIPVQISLQPAGATLSGTTTVTSASGIAAFSDLSIAKAGTAYSLVAQSAGYASATSSKFNVTAGAATKLVFTAQPGNAVSGAHLSPAVQVTAQDAQGNVAAGFTAPITVSLSAGGTLSGTLTQNAVAGVASFADLSVDKAGSYTLGATSGSLTAQASGAFSVTPGTASKLAYVQQPSNSSANAAISPAVKIAVEDAAGNPVPGAVNVTVALGSNPGGANLSGTLTQATASGVATFSDLTLDKVGTGYTLSASSAGLSPLVSSAFDIAAGSGSKLVFQVQASNVQSGASISPPITVAVEDSTGNVVVTSTAAITLAIAHNPAGGTLGGTVTQNAVAGVATFAGLNLDKTGSGYTLSASSSGIASVTGTAFNVSPGSASKLVFTQQPANANNGATLAAIAVTYQDAAGNVVPNATGAVTISIGNNPGGGTLSGTTIANPANGVATFSGLSIDKTGNGYTLTAGNGTLSVTSNAFNITPGLISGTGIVQFIADLGITPVPEDFTGSPPNAYVQSGTGFQAFPGQGDAGGAWSIAGVPTTSFYLQDGLNFVVTSARSVDLGFVVGGRPNVAFATPAVGDAGTYLNVNLQGLNAWAALDTMEIFSSNAGLWAQGIEQAPVDGGVPALGDTQIVQTENYSLYGGGAFVPLVNAAQSDQTWFWQLGTQTATGNPSLQYVAAITDAQTVSLTVPAGGTASVAGTMTTVAQSSSVNLSWNLPAFEGLTSSMGPASASPAFAGHSFFLDAIPTAGHGFYVNSPDLIQMSVLTPNLGSQTLGLAYGDIFSSWTQFAQAIYSGQLSYSVPGIAGSIIANPQIVVSDTLANFPTGGLQPQLSPVRSPLINGTNAFNQIIGVGLNPSLSWTAPTTGTPNEYLVTIYEFNSTGGQVSGATITGRIRTTGTSVVIPPTVLSQGNHYVIQITARSFNALNEAIAPYKSDFPQHSADCFTNVMTP